MLKSRNLNLVHSCWKGLVACHKSNGIITIKKHVEQDHDTLLKKVQKDVNNFPKAPLNHEFNKLWANVFVNAIFQFFSSKIKLEKIMQHILDCWKI
jgi:hypothetical protein